MTLKTEENSHQDRASQSPGFAARPGRLVGSDISEDEALALLKGKNLSAQALASIGRAPIAGKSQKVSFALLIHPRTPRHLSIPLLRRMFSFDLMKVALTPLVAADLKRAAEEQIIPRLKSLTVGERISIARRASSRVVAALLADSDVRVLSAALGNSYLREASVTAVLTRANAPAILFEKVSQHPTWPQKREVQIALLASEKTPIEAVRQLAKLFSPELLDEILPASRRAVI